MSRAKENEDKARRFFTEIWSQGNLNTVDEILEPDFAFILAFTRTDTLDAFRGMVKRNREVFQDLTYVPNDAVADETKASVWWSMTSKHIGTWRNVPASGNDVSIEGVTFFWFSPSGKIQRAVVQNDVMRMMNQIGGIKMLYDS